MTDVPPSNPISQNSSTFNSTTRKPNLCNHGDEPNMFTSMTDEHPARRFYRCPRRKNKIDCGYFDWVDPDLPPYQKGCFVKLKAQKEGLEEQLRCKVMMEKLLSERLEIKTIEIARMREYETELCNNLDIQATAYVELKLKLQETTNQVTGLKKKLNSANVALFVLILFGVLIFSMLFGVSGIRTDSGMLKIL